MGTLGPSEAKAKGEKCAPSGPKGLLPFLLASAPPREPPKTDEEAAGESPLAEKAPCRYDRDAGMVKKEPKPRPRFRSRQDEAELREIHAEAKVQR